MKKAILFISALALSGAATAQSGIKNAVVNVENDYTPEVIEVTKKNFTPEDNTDTNGEPILLIFSKEGKAYGGFTSETDIKDGMPQKEATMPGYIRLGYGLTNDIDAKAAYRLGVGKNGNLKAYAGFDGYKSNVNGLFSEWDSRLFKTTAGVGYTHRFKGLTLGIDGAFKNSTFNYQSSGYPAPYLTDKQDGQSYKAAVSGASSLAGAFSYHFKGDFEHITRKYSWGKERRMGESRYGISGGIGYEMLKCNLGLDLHLNAFTYSDILKEGERGYGNYMSIDADPYSMFIFGNTKLKIGLNINFVTNDKTAFAFAPDIDVESRIGERATFYGSITGCRTENSLAKLESLTPYWGFTENGIERLEPTYKIADVKIGSRLSLEPVSIDINAGYAYTKDDLLETLQPMVTSSSALIYVDFGQQDTHHAYANLLLGCDLRSWMKLSAGARYDFWSCSDKNLLIMKPQVTVDANAEFRVIEHLTMRVGYNFTRYTNSETRGRIGNKNDLYARISYQMGKRLGAYIQGNNLLNCRYYEYAGYQTRGIRGSLGLTVNF